jgi:branched-chain amino acid transport system substrate-binding protein
MANWKEERPPRVAFMIADTEWGRLPLEQGTKYARSIGIEMLPPVFVPFVTLDATTQLLRLSGQEADFAFIQGLLQTTGPVLRDAERLDLLDKIQFGGSGHSMGDALIQMAGPAAEGFTGARTAAWLDETDVPGVKLYIDNQMKYHGKVLRAPEYTTSWPAAAVVCETVRRAIEEVGYENLDRPAVKAVLDNMKDFDVYGIWKVSYTSEDHRGTSAAAVYEIRDGKIIRVSDWRDMPMLIP